MVRIAYAGAGAALVLAASGSAWALEYCVTCEGPPAMYRCVVDGTPDGPGKDPSASLYCISEMASKGRHEACAVSRGAPFPCPGLTTMVKPPPKLPGMAAPQIGAPAPDNRTPLASEPPAPETAPPPEAEKPAKVPRTVEELAGETVRSSKKGLEQAGEAIGGTAKKAGEQIGNAGSAIGNAATKTWNCLTSLFSDCGQQAEPAEKPAPPDEPPHQ
ncbi:MULTISPECIES: hypothetical protein [Hyphomicrobium]|jgi:hypothetical protein|uniref:hypothetical protein n=1 Tax=Hyphomicrobium TaxID=81 RepID=UPI0003A5A2F7|nr:MULTISPECIES: hypothetical protein [Hyphomicrobium]WBT39541.1 hypothetical protein PE058_06570 [Hyphomicrobium sp. DMF-1]